MEITCLTPTKGMVFVENIKLKKYNSSEILKLKKNKNHLIPIIYDNYRIIICKNKIKLFLNNIYSICSNYIKEVNQNFLNKYNNQTDFLKIKLYEEKYQTVLILGNIKSLFLNIHRLDGISLILSKNRFFNNIINFPNIKVKSILTKRDFFSRIILDYENLNILIKTNKISLIQDKNIWIISNNPSKNILFILDNLKTIFSNRNIFDYKTILGNYYYIKNEIIKMNKIEKKIYIFFKNNSKNKSFHFNKLLIQTVYSICSKNAKQTKFINNECGICMEKFNKNRFETFYKCGHSFCLDCVLESMKHNNNCGYCRKFIDLSDIYIKSNLISNKIIFLKNFINKNKNTKITIYCSLKCNREYLENIFEIDIISTFDNNIDYGFLIIYDFTENLDIFNYYPSDKIIKLAFEKTIEEF